MRVVKQISSFPLFRCCDWSCVIVVVLHIKINISFIAKEKVLFFEINTNQQINKCYYNLLVASKLRILIFIYINVLLVHSLLLVTGLRLIRVSFFWQYVPIECVNAVINKNWCEAILRGLRVFFISVTIKTEKSQLNKSK